MYWYLVATAHTCCIIRQCIFCYYMPCFPLWLCLLEDGVLEPKHVGECKLYNSTTYILFVKKVQLVGIMFNKCTYVRCGPCSIVGIPTAYGLDGLGIESLWGWDFLRLYRPALRPTQPPVQWVPGLPGARCGQGVTLTPHPLLVPRSKIE